MAMTFIEQVRLVLGQGTPSVYRYGRDTVDPKAYVGAVGPNTYVARRGEYSVTSEPAVLLEQLYAGTTPENRGTFVHALFSNLNQQNARVVARTLAATQNLAPLAATRDMRPAIEELWRGLIHTLRFESDLFSENDLQTVISAAKRAEGVARAFAVEQAKVSGRERPGWMHRKIPGDAARGMNYLIRTPFEKIVPEAQSVVDRIRYLRLAKTIHEGRNPMDLLRSFYETFVREACGKIETRAEASVPTRVPFQPYKQYLENAGLIVADESAILQSVYNFLSNQGAHKLTSAPEQLRVAHATVVEWCMMVAGRIDAFAGEHVGVAPRSQ